MSRRPSSLGAAIRAERKKAGRTLQEVAKQAEFSISYLSQIERNLLTPSVVLLLDPIVAMGLALMGVFVGLNIDMSRPRLDAAVAIAALGGVAVVFSREAPPVALVLIVLAMAGIALVVAFASWLLVGQTESEREQQVFVVGALLLTRRGSQQT